MNPDKPEILPQYSQEQIEQELRRRKRAAKVNNLRQELESSKRKRAAKVQQLAKRKQKNRKKK